MGEEIIDVSKLSDMMKQYMAIKENYSDCLLFFRLGDFYEMFFDDAVVASRELELTLTGRDCGLEKRAPMCGVPYHSVDTYMQRLIGRGYKVAVCEQLTDPKDSKGLVERGVVRIITPGTVMEQSMLDEKTNNYVCAVNPGPKRIGFAWADVSTGDFYTTEFENTPQLEELVDMIGAINPSELLSEGDTEKLEGILALRFSGRKYNFTLVPRNNFDYERSYRSLCGHFNVRSLSCFDIASLTEGIGAAGALLAYLYETQKTDLAHINRIHYYDKSQYMQLDVNTRRNLEITETMMWRSKKGSLLDAIDRTLTPMGGRKLKLWLEQPLRDAAEIRKRLAGVNTLFHDYNLREYVSERLKEIYDIERLAAKVAENRINPRECVSLKDSLRRLPEITAQYGNCEDGLVRELIGEIDPLEDIYSLLDSAIVDEETPVLITEGRLIKDGYNEELDNLRTMEGNSTSFILSLEYAERERTGIKNLKIKHNKVFGYFIEVSKSNLDQVPYDYIRKQTIANGERFVTAELRQQEEKLRNVQERIIQSEYDLFIELRGELAHHLDRLQKTARAVAELDVICSFASLAADKNYTMPLINEEGVINITDGRHPVVENALRQNHFVPNDTALDNEDNRFMVITGPNMAGKSTYMRQVAIITLLAHIGCFVPAARADISIVDRIFTRVGASDDLASGQSTFMVEMNEVAGILNNATRSSLVILDEIGRGTSTFDGLSIAWAVTEYLADRDNIGAKTLFATHYHEISELEGRIDGVKNYFIGVREHGEQIIFMRKILRGSSDRSFGIQVSRLAGLPEPVINRASEILKRLEDADISKSQISANIFGEAAEIEEAAAPPSREEELTERLKQIDINELTAREAFNIVCELAELAKR
ncbi:MAG: DNA mismatch repair protein MutS [Christensenellaceae bacterium]|nr:DNA mismatch repair protein MutS [Christensenellaceae bacterium]